MNKSTLQELLYSIVGDVPKSLYNRADKYETGCAYSIVTRDYGACFHTDEHGIFTDLTIKRFNSVEEADKMAKTFKFVDAVSESENTELS